MSEFTLGQWTVSPLTHEICNESITIQLRPIQMQLLCLLVEHQGNTLPRETIIEQLWPGKVGADENLSRTMSELRKALGDSVDIKTIPKTGYCLITDSDLPRAINENNTLPPQWQVKSFNKPIAVVMGLICLTVIAVFIFTPKSQSLLESVTVAILPLDNFTDSNRTGLLADGLVEEITHQLARHPKISVASRTSAFYFRDSPLPVVEIGKKLAVSHVLEGSIRLTKNGYRITAQLIETLTGFHLWSKTFDSEENGLLAVQEQIATEVRKLVGQSIAPKKVEVSNELYESYLLGMQAIAEFGPGNLQSGEEHFKAVLAEYPNFSPAKIGLAVAIIAQLNWGQINEEIGFLTAENLLNEVAATEDLNAEYYLARAILYSPKSITQKYTDREKAREWFEKALLQDPNNSRVLQFYARFASISREHANDLNQRALKFDPYNPFLQYHVATQGIERTQTDKLMLNAKALIDKFPELRHGYFLASEIYSKQNDFSQAYIHAYQCVKIQPRFMDCWGTMISSLVAGELYQLAEDVIVLANQQAPSLLTEFSILKKASQGQKDQLNQLMQEVNVELLVPPLTHSALLWAMSFQKLENLTDAQKKHYQQMSSGNSWHQQLYRYHWQKYKDNDPSYINQLEQLIATISADVNKTGQDHRWLLAALTLNGEIDQAFEFANSIPGNHLITNFIFGTYHAGFYHQSIADPFLVPLHEDPRWPKWVAKHSATQQAIREQLLAIQKDFPLSDLAN